MLHSFFLGVASAAKPTNVIMLWKETDAEIRFFYFLFGSSELKQKKSLLHVIQKNVGL